MKEMNGDVKAYFKWLKSVVRLLQSFSFKRRKGKAIFPRVAKARLFLLVGIFISLLL